MRLRDSLMLRFDRNTLYAIALIAWFILGASVVLVLTPDWSDNQQYALIALIVGIPVVAVVLLTRHLDQRRAPAPTAVAHQSPDPRQQAATRSGTTDELRKVAAIILAVLAAFFLYAVFTLPAISTTAPAILLIACAVGAWFLWPRDSTAASTGGRAAGTTTPATRACPNCKGAMGRSENVCPRCATASTPWVFHAGVWWTKGQSGEWQWIDEKARTWRWYKDGTPSDPAATDKTPNLLVDPAVVSPPDSPRIEAATASPTESFAGELERLADLHARGALSDDQFEAAKTRLLGL